MRSMPQTHGIQARLATLAEPGVVWMGLLEQSQRGEQGESLRGVAQLLERCQMTGRRPSRTGHCLTSPRVADRNRVWVNELRDTWREKNCSNTLANGTIPVPSNAVSSNVRLISSPRP